MGGVVLLKCQCHVNLIPIKQQSIKIAKLYRLNCLPSRVDNTQVSIISHNVNSWHYSFGFVCLLPELAPWDSLATWRVVRRWVEWKVHEVLSELVLNGGFISQCDFNTLPIVKSLLLFELLNLSIEQGLISTFEDEVVLSWLDFCLEN